MKHVLQRFMTAIQLTRMTIAFGAVSISALQSPGHCARAGVGTVLIASAMSTATVVRMADVRGSMGAPSVVELESGDSRVSGGSRARIAG